MHELIGSLIAAGPVLTDGAWGTELMRRGLKKGECPESWNLNHPERVEEVPLRYIESGSRIVLTNTFGANRFILEKHDMGDKVREVNKAGVKISKQAAGDKACVFASIGPSGKLIVMKQVSRDELEDAFTEQAEALADAGADAIVIETMIDITEALAAVAAAKKTGLPVVANMVFDAGKDKDRTMMGNTPEEVAEKLSTAGVDVLGSNCGQGIEGFIPICRRMRTVTDLPLWMKANAGMPEIIKGETVYNATPDQYADVALRLVDAGANFIGGCCGTNPDFIAAMKNRGL
ncbi:MAG: homocysteine S-methyltransferase family protein [Deltaproteobacteria bacterium]|nr:homocysteine S-methyltransferase family protein [Deltaproteobacteria bacterium]MBW2218871.1 homocysteine S-methyltransferase family protein [Deltaproteobacteria bacterium]